MIKVAAFNGSPRKNSNTKILIKCVLDKLEEEEIKTELFHLSGNIKSGCTACLKCREKLDKRCVIDTDRLNEYLEKMLEADGIIIGSPTYFATLNTETKAFIDRAGYVSKGNGGLLKRKAGAAVVSVRRAGALNVFQAINNFYLISGMIVPGSIYWNLGMGKEEGDVEQDKEGLDTMETLGENMAWLLKKIND